MSQRVTTAPQPSLIARYRELISIAGPTFVLTAALARLPLAMSQLGTLLLVSGVTGSYAAGGISAGALAVANAVGSPTAGWLTDRLGQRWVLLISSLVGGTALIGLVLAARSGSDWPVLAAIAGLAGFFLPQIGSLARVRWPLLIGGRDYEPLPRRRRVETAFSYEGTADEASFMIGPAAVGLAAALLSPAGALLLAGVMIMTFGSWFALHPTAALTKPDLRVDAPARGRLLSAPLGMLIVGLLFMGMIFGSVQTGSTVLATAAGQPGLTGGLHALLGLGSVIAGLTLPLLPEKYALPKRYRAFALAMALLSLPLLWVDRIGQLPLLLIALGLSVAPYMITIFTIAERISDHRRLGMVMTVLAATIGVGYASGSSLAGRLADLGGHHLAYAVTAGAAVAAAVFSIFGERLLTRTIGQASVSTPSAPGPSGAASDSVGTADDPVRPPGAARQSVSRVVRQPSARLAGLDCRDCGA